jgi:hypothetical protein
MPEKTREVTNTEIYVTIYETSHWILNRCFSSVCVHVYTAGLK